MAKNQSRSMSSEFGQGTVDSTYISICPDRGGVTNRPVERLTWPQYGQAERHIVSPFFESHVSRAGLPIERKATLSR